MAVLKKVWDLEATNTFAVIFDMDGTLIDNTPYHYKSWQALFKKYDKGELSKTTYYTEISGVPIKETLKRLFNTDDEATLKALLNEKESYYRQLYAPFVTAIKGLENFLYELKEAGIKMAMATSATVEDINFILDRVPIRSDFEEIVNTSMVSRPKPNPDIFLKAAEMLNVPPEKCIVFEDSLAGLKAGNSAGMKVVGITTGHPAADLQPVNLVINDYTELSVQRLAALFE
ncbi:HAD superfamily hydrolase (TIGR01509 family)/HAD superfamily hydrolase (TIGR01549 family)/beta-phosphoglucomutase family hydrolase [Mucilaginibacter frigoritolerans]|jgi:beta-phosphoglucomutase|uniref:Beta-phosphoglucomutase n=1 Tax=Mucilaginibacter frigoritolerans TaxID=652788 RepID=A0A562U6S0_9SPHI|nr:HAD family phosphatase [Mucilaginibacter frigoritolerans]TWJ01496.1 HAD superfamily hydrolase (TIGR01509 family)/HAD superfamily hydrolase (TIGR01549 family)/beta-phosphoglucomutase family hydrolase [Mucilaginibacter frigoritolerans]